MLHLRGHNLSPDIRKMCYFDLMLETIFTFCLKYLWLLLDQLTKEMLAL